MPTSLRSLSPRTASHPWRYSRARENAYAANATPRRQEKNEYDHETHAPAELGSGLRRLAEQHAATPFMVLPAAFQVLLARSTGQADFLVGAAKAFRERAAAILGDAFQEWPAFRWRVTAAQHQAARAYSPRPYSGPVCVLRASRQPLLASHAPDLGWSKFVRGSFVVRTVPGGHHSLLNRPYVAALARAVSTCLAAG